ncbi:uncharacterized protein MYCFIDRAFT_79412 [Pseudocercospora fijiensis CIRAD86]|uniref:Uncharacterized protein n=1 Tax=Pseudocercospora fijiensis (strain CIRAD86) TaxID=383855 RepID=M2YP43_PSEFD|nr:uncharacterized protein MYCFIDRAFT_79412 [Pseudocercospora fijiensis CIRAD86]EME79530.1 hypothetical protein MYCFIDRAFT_79412 [Pseudocercospora fijiensis CIRAD86]
MCKIQQRIYKCNHSSEHHISNCLNHTPCNAQQAWSGYAEVIIWMALKCPTCQFEAQKAKYMNEYMDAMCSTRDLRARNMARTRRDDLTEALELRYPQMPLIISQKKRPGLRKHLEFGPRRSRLCQSMTPDDCEVKRPFDINITDDVEAEESQEVGPDGECHDVPMSDVENCIRAEVHEKPNVNDAQQGADDEDQENDRSAETSTAAEYQPAVELSPTRPTIAKVVYWKRKDGVKEIRDYWKEKESPKLPTTCQSALPSLTACQAARIPPSGNEEMYDSRWRGSDGMRVNSLGNAEQPRHKPLRPDNSKKSENPMREYWRRRDSGEQMW